MYQEKLHEYLNKAKELYNNYYMAEDVHLIFLIYKAACTVILLVFVAIDKRRTKLSR